MRAVQEHTELRPRRGRDRIGVEEAGIVPTATTFGAVETAFGIGDESERIDLPKAIHERRRGEFLPSRFLRTRPRHCPRFCEIGALPLETLAQHRRLAFIVLLERSQGGLLLLVLLLQLIRKRERAVCQQPE